jgi:hypothetical protein
MQSQDIVRLFERLRTSAFESRLIEGTPQFYVFVRFARDIVDHVGELLEYDVWERLKFDPQFPWPGLPKQCSVHERRELFVRNRLRLRDEVSLDDVRTTLDFAKRLVGQMFRELALGLMAGDETVPRTCALTVLELHAGFRHIWKPTRRHLLKGWLRPDHWM